MIDQKDAAKNMKIHWLINLISGIVFLIPIISLFYKYTWLSLTQIILISNVTTFCMFLFELPTSVWADTAGRKKSMTISLICSLISAICILLFPSYIWFIVAAVFGALYFSFWSGTGQAFLEENLRILGQEKQFWRHIGRFMFHNEGMAVIAPLISSWILKLLGNTWYTVLAGLDVLGAIVLVYLVLQLKEVAPIKDKLISIKESIKVNRETGKEAIKSVFGNSKMRLVLLYRSLSHHVLFLSVIFLPMASKAGMPDWYGGFVASIIWVWWIFVMKYAYKIGEKYSYTFAWVLATSLQWITLIIAAFLLQSWIWLVVITAIFYIFDGLRQPSWNHVLVELTKWKAIATTRSVVFGIFVLYVTLWKWLLSLFDPKYALIWLGVFIILVNIILGKKILKLKEE